MKDRDKDCNWEIFSSLATKMPCQLVGNRNKPAGDIWIGSDLNYDELRETYTKYGAYLYTGTKPASYCLNFIEAWMTGIPVVALGPVVANGPEPLYEVHELISKEVDGYWADTEDEIVRICMTLLEQPDLAKRIGAAGRQRAIDLFGESVIRPQWEEFFKRL